ncbi:MAG: site-specific recombinase [Candidatus Cyclobacteriaceae bacterium M2_1C_046]
MSILKFWTLGLKKKPSREEKIRLILERIERENSNDRDLLVKLVSLLRPSSPTKIEQASENLDILIRLLNEEENFRNSLKQYIYRIFSSRNSVRTLTELGILSAAGFFAETWRKIIHEILPPVYPENGLMQDLYSLFHKSSDYKWVEGVPTKKWGKLFETLGYIEPHLLATGYPSLNQLLNCILVLSQRITAIGIEPEIVEKMPEIEHYDSPFMVQSREINIYLEKFNDPDFERTIENQDYKHILVMLIQCEEFIEKIRKNKSKFGTSLTLTYSLLRLTQNIQRLRIFLRLVHKTEEKFPFEDEATFFQQLVRAENKKHSLRDHFSQNLSYLAFQITEHTGKKGKHYITATRSQYWYMLRSALGGGFIVGLLAIIKTIISENILVPFSRAFLFSMNYSFGFILIHLTGSTLATKQPAMTASRVAATLDVGDSREQSMENLVEILVRLSRSQFVAFLGNIILAFPIGFGVAYLIAYYTGEPFADEYMTKKIIYELHPFESYALFHAAIAGFFLFLSGLISGYYDNLNLYSKIPQRIRQHPFLNRIFSKKILNGFAGYIDKNLGALTGNFFLGIFLGSTGTIGDFLGLPLDIRHVTFASGNFGIALASMNFPYDWNLIGISLLGIFLIGLVNFIVSFGFTTTMAMKSRSVDFRGTRILIKLLVKRFIWFPQDFFWAPREPHREMEKPEPGTTKPLEENMPVDEETGKGQEGKNL